MGSSSSKPVAGSGAWGAGTLPSSVLTWLLSMRKTAKEFSTVVQPHIEWLLLGFLALLLVGYLLQKFDAWLERRAAAELAEREELRLRDE